MYRGPFLFRLSCSFHFQFFVLSFFSGLFLFLPVFFFSFCSSFCFSFLLSIIIFLLSSTLSLTFSFPGPHRLLLCLPSLYILLFLPFQFSFSFTTHPIFSIFSFICLSTISAPSSSCLFIAFSISLTILFSITYSVFRVCTVLKSPRI